VQNNEPIQTTRDTVMKKVAMFVKAKETKNAVQYQEIQNGTEIVGTIYVKKTTFDGDIPVTIQVAIMTGDDVEVGE
jgi:hypothetical protein